LSYQFQHSSDGVVWTNLGAPVAGTGGTINSPGLTPTPAKAIFRVKRS
jgi:hypothetical protein